VIQPRPAQARGHANHGWLDTYHSFSFAHYYDPNEMGWGCLRVINEDRVQPGRGFGTHGHHDMEILTYILEGALQHRDSLGDGSIIKPGDIQRMSAGTGVQHSEFNPSATEPVHLLQIWIEPDRVGLAPGYEQKTFPMEKKRGRLLLLASSDGHGGSLRIHQNAAVYAGLLSTGDKLTHALAPERLAYLQVVRGVVDLNGIGLTAGDGAKISDERELRLSGSDEAELLLFDLPAAR
jgi:quercetin 2,3-dioxygenase